MITYGNKKIAKAGYCFKKNYGYSFTCLKDEDLDEVQINTNNITLFLPQHFNIDNKFEFVLSDNIKKKLVSNIFSNDDLIAIILNKDLSQEDEEVFDLMQEWREWFSMVIKILKSK